MIVVDGSAGEGGGQIVRTALSLSALTGKPVRVESIRAGRRQPGLRPQHLTAARAAAAICGARLVGDRIGSLSLLFEPQHLPRAGRYEFDVGEAARGGSAGSVGLVLQTILLPLAAAPGSSEVTLRGGTHVAWSPSFHYLQEVLLPLMRRLGISVDISLDTWGWYPQGGGVMRGTIAGVGQDLGQQAERTEFQLIERGDLRTVWGIAASSRLPGHIRQRMRDHALTLLRPLGMRIQIEMVDAPSPGPGAGLFLFTQYDSGDEAGATGGFSGLGRRGKPAETVASEAANALLEHHRSGTPVDAFLADQIVLPLALTVRRAEYRTSEITGHLSTNIAVVQQFLDLQVSLMRSGSNDAVVELRSG